MDHPTAVTLSGYLALSRLPAVSQSLDDRTRMLVDQLAAELSGCRWCIERGRHDWRAAGLPMDLLAELRWFAESSRFTPGERAALAMATAVGGASQAGEAHPDALLQDLQRYFSHREIAGLVERLADHHLLDELLG
jgi:alkylhydroperoxidase family enzyme